MASASRSVLSTLPFGAHAASEPRAAAQSPADDGPSPDRWSAGATRRVQLQLRGRADTAFTVPDTPGQRLGGRYVVGNESGDPAAVRGGFAGRDVSAGVAVMGVSGATLTLGAEIARLHGAEAVTAVILTDYDRALPLTVGAAVALAVQATGEAAAKGESWAECHVRFREKVAALSGHSRAARTARADGFRTNPFLAGLPEDTDFRSDAVPRRRFPFVHLLGCGAGRGAHNRLEREALLHRVVSPECGVGECPPGGRSARRRPARDVMWPSDVALFRQVVGFARDEKLHFVPVSLSDPETPARLHDALRTVETWGRRPQVLFNVSNALDHIWNYAGPEATDAAIRNLGHFLGATDTVLSSHFQRFGSFLRTRAVARELGSPRRPRLHEGGADFTARARRAWRLPAVAETRSTEV